MIAAVFIGACVSFMIQYIDHLAPSELVLGKTLRDKTLNILIFNVLVCLSVGASELYLRRFSPDAKLWHRIRLRIIGAILVLVIFFLLLGLLLGIFSGNMLDGNETGWAHSFVPPLLIGLVQSILLILSPLIKAWILEYATQGLRATTLSILGITKRLLPLMATIPLFFMTQSIESKNAGVQGEFLYWLFLGIAAGCLLIVGFMYLSLTQHGRIRESRNSQACRAE